MVGCAVSDLAEERASGPRTVFVVLRRERGCFRDSGERDGVEDPRLQSALRRELSRSCERTTDIAEIRGRLYATSLYTSAAEPDVAYAETDHDGVPTDAPPVLLRGPQLVDYADRITSKCRVSDALTPDLRIPLDAAFVSPRFEKQGPAGPEEISWERLADHARVVILGEPGAGKTSSLRRLALEATWDRLGAADTVPIFVQLRDFPIDDLTVAGVTRLLRGERVPEPDLEFREPLLAARLLLLIDGLDELSTDGERTTVLENLRELCVQAPRVRVVLTSRDSTYRGELDDFVHLRLLPFDDTRIAQWAFQYLALNEPTRSWSGFVDNLTDDARLRDLVRNPLLLALTTSLSCKYPYESNDVAGLLGKCVEVLLHDWDAARGIARWRHSAVTPRQIVALLSPLSALLAAERRDEFTVDDVRRVTRDHVGFRVSPMVLLSACHTSGLVQDIGTEHWRFTHRALEDYLAASQLVRRTDDLDENFLTLFGAWADRDVWTISCGLASDAGDLLRGALDLQRASAPTAAAIMLAQALAQEVSASRDVVDRCCDLITRTMEAGLQGLALVESDRASVPPVTDSRRSVVWAVGLVCDDPDRDLTMISRLLSVVHRARSGTAGAMLAEGLASSKVPAVRRVAEALSCDGRWRDTTIENQGRTEFWIMVTRLAEAERDQATTVESSADSFESRQPPEG